MNIKIKKLCDSAVIPTYAHSTDAGVDLYSTEVYFERNKELIVYSTGIAIEIPEGYVGLIFPRSSITKTNLSLSNCVGVIDSGYRGEILLKFRKVSKYSLAYKVGERIGQLIILPYPKINFIEVDKLTDTERGESGYGSSGN